MKDWKIIDRQIIVNEKYFGENELNSYFTNHKLITDDYTETDIEYLIDSVAFYLDWRYGLLEEEFEPGNSDILLMEKFLGEDYHVLD